MCLSVSRSIYVSELVSVCAWCVWVGAVCEWSVYRQLQCSGLLWWDTSEEMALYLPLPRPHEHRAGSLWIKNIVWPRVGESLVIWATYQSSSLGRHLSMKQKWFWQQPPLLGRSHWETWIELGGSICWHPQSCIVEPFLRYFWGCHTLPMDTNPTGCLQKHTVCLERRWRGGFLNGQMKTEDFSRFHITSGRFSLGGVGWWLVPLEKWFLSRVWLSQMCPLGHIWSQISLLTVGLMGRSLDTVALRNADCNSAITSDFWRESFTSRSG